MWVTFCVAVVSESYLANQHQPLQLVAVDSIGRKNEETTDNVPEAETLLLRVFLAWKHSHNIRYTLRYFRTIYRDTLAVYPLVLPQSLTLFFTSIFSHRHIRTHFSLIFFHFHSAQSPSRFFLSFSSRTPFALVFQPTCSKNILTKELSLNSGLCSPKEGIGLDHGWATWR